MHPTITQNSALYLALRDKQEPELRPSSRRVSLTIPASARRQDVSPQGRSGLAALFGRRSERSA